MTKDEGAKTEEGGEGREEGGVRRKNGGGMSGQVGVVTTQEEGTQKRDDTTMHKAHEKRSKAA